MPPWGSGPFGGVRLQHPVFGEWAAYSKEAAWALVVFPPTPRLLAYTPESVIAEKFHTMVIREKANSRMKDLYNLRILASHVRFRSSVLREAIKKIFGRRYTDLPRSIPVALTAEFSEDPVKITQWEAFVRGLPAGERAIDLETTEAQVRAFLLPGILDPEDDRPGDSE